MAGRWWKVLFVVLSLSSCRQLFDLPSTILSNESNIKINVSLESDGTINPGYDNQGAQPVKACFFIVKSKYWSPDGVYDGIPCKDTTEGNEVIDSRELMVSPNQSYQLDFDIVYNRKDDAPLWLVAGANFQQLNDFKPIDRVEIIKKHKKIAIPVKITRNEILVGKVETNKNNKNNKNKDKKNGSGVVVF
ncbi:hypothetical protein GKC56_07160 [Neisseriaceae bacterium PsAf]|nr:hypothetical protein [Neisseriaceae bacterium PsAf]MCV2503559.1 hypothetical protein [Neisseriaceae bacterium]